MGIRLKLGLHVVGFVGVIFAVTSLFTIRYQRDIFSQEMERRGVTLLRSFAIPASIAMANSDTATLDNYVVQFAEAAHSLDLEALAVLDFEGRVVSHTRPGEYGKVYDDPFTRQALGADVSISRTVEPPGQSPTLLIAVPVKSRLPGASPSGGLRWGTIRAVFALANTERAVARSQRQLLWTGMAVSLGAAGIAYFLLSLVVIGPVVRMSEMARRFGSGVLDARVQLRQEDEVGELAEQLNRMAGQIQDYTVALERKVEERTGELAEANQKLRAANQALDRLARTDPLTGLANRRHFMEQLQFEVRRGTRTFHQFCMLIMDVDHFKHYNDTNGHTAGDEILQRLAALFQINLRATDVVARYGGEEFTVLLLDTSAEEGTATANKLQQLVEAQPLPYEERQPGGKVTISVGLSFYPDDSVDARTLIEYADRALYHSKANGRNSVTRWCDLAHNRNVG